MKIKGTLQAGRSRVPGRTGRGARRECPWDGQPFNADYAVVLVESLREAERLGTELERALERVASLNPAFVLDEESVLAPSRRSSRS